MASVGATRRHELDLYALRQQKVRDRTPIMSMAAISPYWVLTKDARPDVPRHAGDRRWMQVERSELGAVNHISVRGVLLHIDARVVPVPAHSVVVLCDHAGSDIADQIAHWWS